MYLNFCYASYLNFNNVLPVVIFNVLLYFFGSFKVLHILTYCTFQCAVVCLPIVPFCTQLYLSVHSCIFDCCTFQCLYLLVCFWILTVILLSVLSCFLTCVQKQGLHPPGEDCHSLWFSCVRQPCLDSLGFLLHCFLHKQHS